MTPTDLDRIESELGINLPQDYRDLAGNFPVRFWQGNASTDLWDNAEELIQHNRELWMNTGSRQSLPRAFLFIGEDGEGFQNLIDLRESDSVLYSMEFEDPTTIRPFLADNGQPQNILDWYHTILTDLHEDGIDINADREVEPSINLWKANLGSIIFALVVAAFVIVLVVLYWVTSGQS